MFLLAKKRSDSKTSRPLILTISELSRIFSRLRESYQRIALYTAEEICDISAFAVSYPMFLVSTQIT